MAHDRPADILIGPRTTVFTLLEAYPALESYLAGHGRGFQALTRPGGRVSWARVTTLNDVALDLNETWREIVEGIAAEITRLTGRAPRVADAPRVIADDDARLTELRRIGDGLEEGAPLPEMAARWRAATGDLDPLEIAAFDRALAATQSAARRDAGRRVEEALHHPNGGVGTALPAGHPLETLRCEAGSIEEVCGGLRTELERLGGSPTRGTWRRERSAVSRLVERLSGVESRFRRHQQAWFPALAVHGVDGPQGFLAERQAEALETLRRLRLAIARDDAPFVAENGARLIEQIEDLLAQDEHLLVPLAERHFSAGDWAAVRDLEEGVGWSLIPAPPPWPPG